MLKHLTAWFKAHPSGWEIWMAAAIIGTASIVALLCPIWNWDFIAYQGLAAHVWTQDWTTAHTSAYNLVHELSDANQARLLWDDVGYRATVASSPESLKQLSVFYADRVLYYGLLALLERTGIPAILAFPLLGAATLFTSGCILWRWMCSLWGERFALVILAPLLVFSSLVKTACLGTPDALVAALLLAGTRAWIVKGPRHSLGWWLAMILARPNTAIWLAPIGAFEAFRLLRHPHFKGGDPWLVSGLLALGACMAALHSWGGDYGLAVLLHHTFDTLYAFPAQANVAWSWSWYAHLLGQQLFAFEKRDILVFAMLIGSLTWIGYRRRKDANALLAYLLATGAALQLAIFPVFWYRHYTGLMLVVLLLAFTYPSSKTRHS